MALSRLPRAIDLSQKSVYLTKQIRDDNLSFRDPRTSLSKLPAWTARARAGNPSVSSSQSSLSSTSSLSPEHLSQLEAFKLQRRESNTGSPPKQGARVLDIKVEEEITIGAHLESATIGVDVADGPVLVRDDLASLLQCLPGDLRETLLQHPRRSELLEVILDLGRRPEARFLGNSGGEYLREDEISREDLEAAQEKLGEFGGDNRAGVEGTLHRISAIRNRKGHVVGLTCRVGRAVTGHVDMIRDVLHLGQSLLFLGRPGVGKTTVIREIARVLADDLHKRVVIVDTSNEIGGDGDVPHPAIGGARRMQVPDPAMQHQVMIEAVENHMPEVVIVDEIGTEEEALACRTIAERGVMLVGTAHGQMLENIIKNPTLCDLVGGIQTVTLGDDEARSRGTQKSVLERKGPPTFPLLVEMRERNFWVAHQTDRSVDALLLGRRPQIEVRARGEDFQVRIDRKLYDSCGNGRLDGDYEYSLGVPSASAAPAAEVDRIYAMAAKLGHVPDKDAAAAAAAEQVGDGLLMGAQQHRRGSGSSSWDDLDEEFFSYSNGFTTSSYNIPPTPGKRGSRRGPRGVRPR